MSDCKIQRRKLVTYGTMSFDGSPMKITGKKWVEEPCGTPIFGDNSAKRNVCDSCLKGWSVDANMLLDTEENKKLLSKAKKQTANQ